ARLRTELGRVLPDYMVPSAIVVLETMPLSPNGKVDRKALPAPERPLAETAYVEPRTETEVALARIWGDVLRIDRVGVHDRFFDLGGHSLLATRVAAEVRRQLIVELPLQLIYRTASLEELANYVDSQHEAALANVNIANADQLLDELEEGDL
ncbi:phosphopantetheine-binding protein, partial [Paraburkholderia sp. BCC1885]|uniref:phosphopantetheine-binding protein n=1 Tax=Paraburkholderia sp. BCC1885 TaxID=2562669 RepID=UPI0021B2A095